MRFRFLFAASRLAWALALSLLLHNACGAPQSPEPKTAADMAAAADPNDAIVAQIAADKLQEWNYSQHPFDEEMSSKFLDRFLDTLDHFHVYFLKSDISEFEQYRTNLNVLTLRDQDISPCWVIFARFMERVHQRIDLAGNLLESAKFDFTGHERFVQDRHALPYARDLDEAREFWRQDLRCEYLDQLLNSPDVQFTGPVSVHAKGGTVVTLTRDKTHPLSFDYLPATFRARNGRAIGRLDIAASQSNATLRLDLPSNEHLRKTTNQLYSARGEEIGDVTFRREKTETNDVKTGTNGAVSSAPPTSAPAKLEAVIRLNQKNLAEIHKTLTNHYAQMLRNYKMLETDRAFELYVNSLARAFDPHSDFMGHMTAENFGIQMKLSLIGIGAVLGQDSDYCKIEELKEGPARKSGKVKTGDRIVAVAQSNAEPVDVIGMPLDKIVEMIRGPKGTQVTLTLIPVGAADSSVHKDVTLIRDEIKLEDQEAKARLYETPGAPGAASRLGVITIPSFYADNESLNLAGDGAASHAKSMTADVARLVKRLKQEKVGGIILDLRYNGGGYLEEAIKLTGLFVRGGPVVQTKDPAGEVVTDSCRGDSVLYDGPLVLLTSRLSASASEILAGALQDYNRALIVGDHSTFGKGTVQTMQNLKPFLKQYLRQKHMDYNPDYNPDYDPGSLKITIKKFYRAGGVSTQLKGVESDIELPSKLNADTADIGESALPNALPCDEVTSANPENLNRVKPCLAELQERSRQRVAASKDFAFIQEDIARFLKQQADRSVSLNLVERQAEKKAETARSEAIKKELLSRKKSDEKVFEISLKNVDLAQLQPLPASTNSPAAPVAPAFDDESEPDEDAAAGAAGDPTLEETRRILADYIALVNKEPAISKAP